MIRWECYRNHSDEKGARIGKGESPLVIATSECPMCRSLGLPAHEHVEGKSQLFWCETCRAPLYTETCDVCDGTGKKLAKDIRPVFPEEKVLLEILWEQPAGSLMHSSVWNAGSGIYFVDGKRKTLRIQDLINLDYKVIRRGYEARITEGLEDAYEWFENDIKTFVVANKNRYSEIINEAFQYIRRETEGFSLTQMFTSFSGGKDSTVVADLAKRALGTDKLLHIFGDTTLEYPDTLAYVERYKKEHKGTPFVISKNKENSFDNLCAQIGPPSRVMRWCCTIFKTGSINRKIQSMFRNENRIVSFQGIRRAESASRSKYDRTSTSSKIAKQVVVSPIIDWLDFDIWLYILTTGMDFNDAYRKGYSRVGCWCCPNNGAWSEFLSSIFNTEPYERFHGFLEEFARSIGKNDAEEYVRSGAWKARQGGNGVAYADTSIVDYTPCVKEENAYNYELRKPITPAFYELFKPFGRLDFDMGNARLGEVYVLDRNNNPVIKLQGRQGKNKLKITIYQIRALQSKSMKAAKEKMDCQITKYQMCMGCRGCESVCRFGAISVKQMPDGSTSYTIDDARCIGCKECVNHYTGGCYMRKVLTIKR